MKTEFRSPVCLYSKINLASRNLRTFAYLLMIVCAAVLPLSCGQGGKFGIGSDKDSGVQTASKALVEDLMINNSPDDQSQPDVAYDAVNNLYLTVWTDNRAPLANGSDIYGAFVNGITNSVEGTAFRISDSTRNEIQPKVAYDKDSQRYLAVWTDTRSGAGRIYGRFINAVDGNPLGSDFLISRTANIVITNTIDDGVSPATKTITRTTQFQSEQSPSIVYNEVTQKFMVAWLDSTNYEHNYFYNRADFSNTVCTQDFGNDNTSDLLGTIAQDTTGDKNIFYAQYLSSGVADTSVVMYRDVTYSDATDATDSDADGSDLDSTIQRQSAVTFITDPGAGSTECTDTGQSLTVAATVFIMGSESYPTITYNPIDGTPYVLWSGKGKTVRISTTWSRSFDKDLNVWSPWGQDGPTYATDSSDSYARIYLRSIIFGTANDLKLGNDAANSSKPTVSTNVYRTAPMMLVAWETQENSENKLKNIYGQLINLSNGLPEGNSITISNEQYDQSSPKAAFDTVNERYLVVWEDARNTEVNVSNMDIFGQFIDPQGQLSGSNFPVTVNSANQLVPSVAFGDNDVRRFFIAWKDGRENQNSDIYGQLWEYSVAPQLLITDGSDNNPIYNQAIDFGRVRVKQAGTQVFRIWNKGNAPLTINPSTGFTNSPEVAIQLSPVDGVPFNITTPKPSTINPGTYYEMSVLFSPPQTGSFNGSIGIDSNGGRMNLYFSGFGITSNLAINPPTSLLNSLTATIGTYDEATFTVTNTGNADLKISSFTVSSPFSLPGLSIPLTLTPGEQEVVTVRFTPTAAGTVTKDIVIISDDSGIPSDGTGPITTYTVDGVGLEVLNILTTSLPGAINGVSYSQSLSATGGLTPYSWSLVSGSLPAGMSLDTTNGIINGTPGQAGTFTFEVQLTDAIQNKDTQRLTLEVTPPAVNITTSSLASWTATISGYSQILNAIGGTSYTWTVDSGSLPVGLSLDPSTGAISGTPSTPGSYTFRIKVTDIGSATATKSFTISINPQLSILTTSLPSSVIGETYNETFLFTGGTAPYSWIVNSGSLPSGVSLNPSTGQISGIPSASMTATFSVELEDSLGATTSKAFSIVVNNLLSIETATLPDGSVNTAYGVTLVANGGRAPYQWTKISGALPQGLALDANTGLVGGTPIQAGQPYTFIAQVTDTNGRTAQKTFQITITDLTLVTTSLNDASTSQLYSAYLVGQGGTLPYTWSVVAGSLPAGLALDSAGLINGTPSTVGQYSFAIQLQDSSGKIASRQFNMSVSDIAITTGATLPGGSLNTVYSATIAATGGVKPYTWSIVAGTLPSGLTFGAPTGVLSGTPATGSGGTYDIMVQVEDSTAKRVTKLFSITISDLTITTSSLADGSLGSNYSASLQATGGASPYDWTYSGGLPAGLSLSNSTGMITGTPTAAGTSYFVIQIADSASPQPKTTTKSFSITISDLAVTTTTLPDGSVGAAYMEILQASGGSLPYSWTTIAGSPPAGTTLNSSTGVLSGTPTASGPSTFIVRVTDNTGRTANKTLSILISDLTITTTALADGSLNTPYSATVSASGGTKPYSWTTIAGGLPTGLSINAATGVISGTPTVAGSYDFVVQVTDAGAKTAAKTLSINISDLAITSVTLVNGTVGQSYIDTITASGGTVPYSWSLTAGILPPGLGIDAYTGVISGTPTSMGTYYFVAKVADLSSKTAQRTLSITVVSSGTTTSTTTTTAPAAPSEESGACFIATAAYGSYLDSNVKVLRDFRDKVLLTNKPGRAFVAFYYRTSPPLASFIARHDSLRTAARFALTPIIYGVKYPMLGFGLIFAAGGALLGAFRRRKK